MSLLKAICLALLATLVGCEKRSETNDDVSPEVTAERNSALTSNTVTPAASFQIGMPKRDVFASLTKLDAIDITSGATYMNVDTGDHVTEGIVYSLPHHDTTIAFHYDDSDRLTLLIHCDGVDYEVSKQHRAESEVYCEHIVYNSDGTWIYTPMADGSG